MARPGIAPASKSARTLPEVLVVFLCLGLTSCGGLVAYVGRFRKEVVCGAAEWTRRPTPIWWR
ncbi:MAG: hypothetical protein ACUVS4_14280 [Chloroflexaceae bacterium]